MKLFMHPMSQHARRVMILCRELGLAVEPVPVALDKGEQKHPDFIARSVMGRVPLLEDGDFRLPESHAIMRYLCDREGADGYYPKDARTRAQIDAWLDWTHASLNPPVQTAFMEKLFKGDRADKEVLAASRDRLSEALAVMERGRGVFPILSERINIADIAMATTLALHELAGGDLSAAPGIAAWLHKLKARPSFAATAPRMS